MTKEEVLKLKLGDIIEVEQPDGTWVDATFRAYQPEWGTVDNIGYTLGYQVSPFIDGGLIAHISFDKVRSKHGDDAVNIKPGS